MSSIADYIVPVKKEYLISKDIALKVNSDLATHNESTRAAEDSLGIQDPVIAIPNNEKRGANSFQTSNKKRPRESRPKNSNDRLCLSFNQGIPCSYGNTCQYSHDAIDYLSRKPKDINNVCYHYETFGFCSNGLMCRFGDLHINRRTCENLIRNHESGGIKDKIMINVLSKDLQHRLRKKLYNYKHSNPNVESTSITVVNPLKKAVTSSNLNETLIENETLIVESHVISESDSSVSTANCGQVSTTSSQIVDEVVSPPSLLVENETVITSSNNITKSVQLANSDAYDTYVKLVDFSNKIYVAPLTTVGNLPYRRILKDFGADITCGEMSMTENLQQGQASEWALLRRHESETVFGVQLACAHGDQMERMAKIINNEVSSDFVDLNCGCPIDVVCSRGCGSSLLNKQNKLLDVVKAMTKNLNRSITVKVRTGWDDKHPNAHKLVPQLQKISNNRLAAIMVHGRSRQQRYSKKANWEYILEVAKAQNPEYRRIPIIGNGDILSWEDWESHQALIRNGTDDIEEIRLCSCAMIARGALMKPWLAQEIKEKRSIDMSSSQRFDILKRFCNYGLEHWGSDQQGVNTTRRFLLESLSFLYRFVPVGLIEYGHVQKMSQRPPNNYFGRDDMETLMASSNSNDWIKISELLLGPVEENFVFVPKHKSNSTAESDSNG